MKNYVIYCIAFSLITISCTKSNDSDKADCPEKEALFTGTGMAGKWKYIESFGSPGDQGKWYPANPTSILQLNTDGTICGDYLKGDVVKYELRQENRDSVIKFSLKNGTIVENRYSLRSNELFFYPYPMNCFEGCADKLVRLK